MDQAQTHDRAAAPAAPERGRYPREHYAPWRGVHVTEAILRVGDRTYEIARLRRLRELPGRPQPARQTVLGIAAGQAAIVAIAVGGLVNLNGWTPVLGAVVAAQALVTTALVGLALLRWRTPTELWALHHGELTMLYRNADRYEFGKVRRAVERAMLAQRLVK
jgi:Family of unknown function (DUF6232)